MFDGAWYAVGNADPQTEFVYLCGVVRNALTFINLQFLFILGRDHHC